jgi:hypothetical protein
MIPNKHDIVKLYTAEGIFYGEVLFIKMEYYHMQKEIIYDILISRKDIDKVSGDDTWEYDLSNCKEVLISYDPNISVCKIIKQSNYAKYDTNIYNDLSCWPTEDAFEQIVNLFLATSTREITRPIDISVVKDRYNRSGIGLVKVNGNYYLKNKRKFKRWLDKTICQLRR